MKKNKKTKKRNVLFYKILSFLLIIVSTFFASTLFYFNIIPNKYLISGFIVFCMIIFFVTILLNKKTRLITKLIISLAAIILIIAESAGIFYAFGTLDFLNNIFDTGFRSETYNMYVLKDSDVVNLKGLNNKKISFYNLESEIYTKAKLKLDEIISYDEDLVDNIGIGVDNVISKKTSALFLSESFMAIYKEDHPEKYSQLKILDSINVMMKISTDFNSVNVESKPFALYLSGSDAYGSIQKSSRSDVNLLLVVNPKTEKILLINTPRDYYITLPSKNAKDKLTHAGIYGIEESALTLSKLYQVDINYYARVNFTSFVKIIDALDGINVDSKYSFSNDGYYFKKGTNELTGKAALAFSRSRSLPGGDRGRGESQQAVIIGLINKLSDKSVLTKYTSLLKTLEKGVMTNMDKDTIAKLVNVQLKRNIKWQIETVNADGANGSRPTYSAGSTHLSIIEPDLESVSAIKVKIRNLIEN